MPRSQQTEEVRILKFFEEAPLEKAELLFDIVKDKMRSRMQPGSAPAGTARKTKNKLSASIVTDAEPKTTATGAA
jgi:hypothetical protein